MAWIIRAAALTCAAVVACGCKGEPDPTAWCSSTGQVDGTKTLPAAPTYYQDARVIIDAKCAFCHSNSGIGGLPLTTYEEVKAVERLAPAAIAAHEMPPWLAARCCTSYYRDYSLAPAEEALLLRWFDTGAAAGDDVAREPSAPIGGLSRVDLTLTMSAPYTPAPPAGTTDDTRCFVLDWPLDHAAYVTGMNPVPGVREVVHHLVIGVVSGSDAKRAVERDSADARPGYACVNPLGEYQKVAILGGGLVGGDYPRGIGTRIEAGSKIILSVHYSTDHAPPTPDTTAVQFRLDAAAVEAKPIIVTNLAWAIGDGMAIPAGKSDAVFYYRYRPDLFTRGKTVKLQSVTPHMHEFATKMVVRRITPSGRRECLLEIPNWSFGWEQPFWFANEMTLEPDDELYLECHFDNSTANQPDGKAPRDIAWGGNDQDMCAAFLAFTE